MKFAYTYLVYSLIILSSYLCAANAIAMANEPQNKINKIGSDPNIKLVNVPYSAVAKLPQVTAEKNSDIW